MGSIGDTGTTFVSRSQRNKIHRDIVTLQKWKEQLFNSLVVSNTQYIAVIDCHVIQCDEPYNLQQGDLLELPSVVLHHVISYLTDPCDLLNFGLTHPLVNILWIHTRTRAHARTHTHTHTH